MKTGKFAGFETGKKKKSMTCVFKTGKFAGFFGDIANREGGCHMKRLAILILSLCVAVVPLPSVAALKFVSRQELGEQWPFTVEDGRLGCLPPGAVFFVAGNQTYAINGSAVAVNQKFHYNWRPVEDIWRFDEKSSNEIKKASPDAWKLRINIGPIIDLGLNLCQ